jgi:hypothetical protein
MSRWVLVLLVVYFVLGLRSRPAPAMTRFAIWATAGVVLFAAFKAGSL